MFYGEHVTDSCFVNIWLIFFGWFENLEKNSQGQTKLYTRTMTKYILRVAILSTKSAEFFECSKIMRMELSEIWDSRWLSARRITSVNSYYFLFEEIDASFFWQITTYMNNMYIYTTNIQFFLFNMFI